jgi:nicotinamidase-related amidase
MAPLLSSSDTAILFVDPRRQHFTTLQNSTQQPFADALELLVSAASMANIAPYFVTDPAETDPNDWFAKPGAAAGHHIHVFSNSGPTWSDSGLALALAAENKPNLVICGFWLETKVSFLALYALSAGFDVFLVSDATPSRARHARQAAQTRLVQSGVVPTTTHQLLAEWAEQSADPALRANLFALPRPR